MIIGSHDSTAYTLDMSQSFWSSASKWNILRKLTYICCLIKAHIYNLTLTQKHTITEQLDMGVRALDIRVTRNDNGFFCAHTFATISVDKLFNEIFMANTTDTIHVFIRHDYSSLKNMVGHEEEFANFVETLVVGMEHVKVYYDKKPATHNGRVTNFQGNKIVWLDSQSVNEFIDKFHKTTLTPKSLLNFVLTPDSITSKPIKTLARELNRHTKRLLRGKESFVVFVDFLDKVVIQDIQDTVHPIR